jgi:hypothetical protein
MWEELLDAQFYEFHQRLGSKSISFHRSLGYSLPEDLVAHVHSLFLTVDLPPTVSGMAVVHSTTPTKVSNAEIGRVNGYVTPALLNSYYSISSNQGSSSVSQTVFATLGQTFSPTDLTCFQNTFGLPLKSISSNYGPDI